MTIFVAQSHKKYDAISEKYEFNMEHGNYFGRVIVKTNVHNIYIFQMGFENIWLFLHYLEAQCEIFRWNFCNCTKLNPKFEWDS